MTTRRGQSEQHRHSVRGAWRQQTACLRKTCAMPRGYDSKSTKHVQEIVSGDGKRCCIILSCQDRARTTIELLCQPLQGLWERMGGIHNAGYNSRPRDADRQTHDRRDNTIYFKRFMWLLRQTRRGLKRLILYILKIIRWNARQHDQEGGAGFG